MKNGLLIAALALVFTLGTTACDNGGGGKGNVAPSGGGGENGNGTGNGTPQKPIQIDTQSCVYKLNDGGSVDMSHLQRSDVQAVSFQKKFNTEYLKAIGLASIPETIKFVNRTEAQAYQSYHVYSTECEKDLFIALPTLPTDLAEQWKQASPNDPNSVLMGLYLPKDPRAENTDIPSIRGQAAILIRTNTSRWTLVHEFMHHLFMLQSVAEGYDENKAFSELEHSRARIKEINDNAALNFGQKIDMHADNYQSLVLAYDSMMVHFPLEEMTVEKTMKEYMRNHQLDYAPESSNWYIQGSAEKARKSYDEVLQFGQQIIDAANGHPGHEAAAEKVRTANRLIQARYAEMNQITTAYPNRGSISQDLAKAWGLEMHEGCSHEGKAEELLAMVSNLSIH